MNWSRYWTWWTRYWTRNGAGNWTNRSDVPLSLVLAVFVVLGVASSVWGEENRSPSVGVPGSIEQLVLPGTELEAKPLVDERAPIVVRIVASYPHGDRFRYDLEFQGFVPGEYDLADYLVRKDGSTTEDLPEIPVEIRSLLPPGQLEPNALGTGQLPRLGGYQILAIAALVVWLLVFAGLICWGKGKQRVEQARARKLTLADLLKPRLESAMANRLEPSHYAELERMLSAFWRRRLELESLPTDEAIARIKSHPEAGPLMTQLEHWMHDPRRDRQVDLGALLEPYGELSAELLSADEAKVVSDEF